MGEIPTGIDGVVVRAVKKFTDDRGSLCECFRRDELPPDLYPAMSYVSMTYPAIVRGPHEHIEQTDYFFFPGPAHFTLYLWDNRPQSPTFGKKAEVDIPGGDPMIAIVPPRVVHAYRNKGVLPGLVLNFPNKLYAGEGKKEKVDEVRYEDGKDTRFRV